MLYQLFRVVVSFQVLGLHGLGVNSTYVTSTLTPQLEDGKSQTFIYISWFRPKLQSVGQNHSLQHAITGLCKTKRSRK